MIEATPNVSTRRNRRIFNEYSKTLRILLTSGRADGRQTASRSSGPIDSCSARKYIVKRSCAQATLSRKLSFGPRCAFFLPLAAGGGRLRQRDSRETPTTPDFGRFRESEIFDFLRPGDRQTAAHAVNRVRVASCTHGAPAHKHSSSRFVSKCPALGFALLHRITTKRHF